MAPFWPFIAALGLVAAEGPAQPQPIVVDVAKWLEPKLQGRSPEPVPGTWPNHTIPFYVPDEPWWLRDKVKKAQQDWEKHTCINFVHKDQSHSTWLNWIVTRHSEGDKCMGAQGYPGPAKGGVNVVLRLPNSLWEMVKQWTWKGCGEGEMPLRAVRNVLGPGHGESVPFGPEVTYKDYAAVNMAYGCPGAS